MQYTLRSNNGDSVTVEAINEATARHNAMVALWDDTGKAYDIQASGRHGEYRGRGLSLLEVIA